MSWALLSNGYPTQRTSIPMSQCPWFTSFQCFLRWAAVFPELKQRGLPNDQAGPSSWLGAVSRLRAAIKCVIHSWEEAASSSCRGIVSRHWPRRLCLLCALVCLLRWKHGPHTHSPLLSPSPCFHAELFHWTEQPASPFNSVHSQSGT